MRPSFVRGSSHPDESSSDNHDDVTIYQNQMRQARNQPARTAVNCSDVTNRRQDSSSPIPLSTPDSTCAQPSTVERSKQRRPRQRDSLYAQQAGLHSLLPASSRLVTTSVDQAPDVPTAFVQDQVNQLRADHPVLQLDTAPVFGSASVSPPRPPPHHLSKLVGELILQTFSIFWSTVRLQGMGN